MAARKTGAKATDPRVKTPRKYKQPIPTEELLSRLNGHTSAPPTPTNTCTGLVGVGDLQCFSSIIPTRTEWILEPYLPRGRLMMLVGETQAGKSVFMSAVVAHITGGPSLNGGPRCHPSRAIIYSPEEEASEEILNRLIAAGTNLDRVVNGLKLPDGRPTPPLIIPDRLDYLESRIKSVRASLVFLDPVTSFVGGSADASTTLGVRACLDPLVALASRTGCTIVCTLHYRKSRTGGPLDWVSGNAAWTQVPRFVLAFGRDPTDPAKRIMAMPKCSINKPVPSITFTIEDIEGTPLFRWGGHSAISAADMGAPIESREHRGELAEARDYLKDCLDAEDRPVREMVAAAKECGIAPRTLRRAKEELGVTSHHAGAGAGRHIIWRRPSTWPG